MAGDRSADGAGPAGRVNGAAALAGAGVPPAEAARMLAARFTVSARQARRYVDQAAAVGRVLVPEPGVVFTVKLPGRLAVAVREHAWEPGRTISAVVAQALEAFLAPGRRDHSRKVPA